MAENQESIVSGTLTVGESLPQPTSSDQVNQVCGQQPSNVSPMFWTGPAAISSTSHALQPEASSSLLWPDSENFFQSLTSTEGTLWDQCIPGLFPPEPLPQQPPVTTATAPISQSPYDEPTVTEDGRRAVHTTNGLLTNTVGRFITGVRLSADWNLLAAAQRYVSRSTLRLDTPIPR